MSRRKWGFVNECCGEKLRHKALSAIDRDTKIFVYTSAYYQSAGFQGMRTHPNPMVGRVGLEPTTHGL